MFSMEKIGAFIAAKRRESGLTQGQFAEKLNVTHQAVSKWERGEAMPEISKIGEVAKLLGVSADDILVQMSDDQTPLSFRNEMQADDNKISYCAHEKPKYTEADMKYFSLGGMPSISDVYELAPDMSSDVLADAVQRLLRDNGSFAVTLFLPMLDKKTAIEITERIYNNSGLNGVISLGKYLPAEFVDKIILREYGRGNLESLKLLPYSKNDVVINAVFDAEVARLDTWNSLINIVSSLPQSVLVHQGVKFALSHELGSFATWWGRLGRDTSALLMVGYAKMRGYIADAWQQVARFYGNGNADIIEKAVQESIKQCGIESVLPLQKMRRQNNYSDNFSDNIQRIVDNALFHANEGIRNSQYPMGKNKKAFDMDILHDILREYTAELKVKIDSLDSKINGFEELINNLEDRICELEVQIDGFENVSCKSKEKEDC